MPFEVVVLGAAGTHPAPDAACSGYLLRADAMEVWVDAGPGTLANLQRSTDFAGLGALVLTHLHLDHVVDVYSLYHWIRFARTNPGIRTLPVYAPAGAGTRLASILGPYAEGFGEWLVFHPLDAATVLTPGLLRLTFVRTRHPVETYAVRAEARGRALVYTADTGPSDDVTAFARGADVLVAEATLQDPVDPSEAERLLDVHMTAGQAGAMAAAAGAGRLVLTHIPPGTDPSRSVEQAAARYGGPISVAHDGLVIDVGGTGGADTAGGEPGPRAAGAV